MIYKAIQVTLVIIWIQKVFILGKKKRHPRYLNYGDKTREIKCPRMTYYFGWTFKASQALVKIYNQNFVS